MTPGTKSLVRYLALVTDVYSKRPKKSVCGMDGLPHDGFMSECACGKSSQETTDLTVPEGVELN